jgi:hypothetical protein
LRSCPGLNGCRGGSTNEGSGEGLGHRSRKRAGHVVVLGIATAQTDQPVSTSPGPSVDFCPTLDETEAHLAEYGYDYKPTVTCGRDGEVQASGPSDEEVLSDSEAQAREKELLTSAIPGPDFDGDPTTIEGILPDGTTLIITVATNDPKHYEGMTPAEFAEEVYP